MKKFYERALVVVVCTLGFPLITIAIILMVVSVVGCILEVCGYLYVISGAFFIHMWWEHPDRVSIWWPIGVIAAWAVIPVLMAGASWLDDQIR